MSEKAYFKSPAYYLKELIFSIILFLCFSFLEAQNPNANENATVEGGSVSVDGLTYVEVCVGDDVEDIVHFDVEGASGRLKQWVITDDNDNILYLPDNPWFDFNEEFAGVCRVYHLSYNGMKPLVKPFWHKHIKNLLEDLRGKYDISDNYIEIKKIKMPKGGDISLADGSTEIEICAGDGVSDLFDVDLNGAEGPNMIWVVTDLEANILKTMDTGAFDFEGAGGGTCLIWHLSYAENVSLEGVTNATDLTGCFDFSNAITVIRNGVEAGDIQISDGSTEIEICAGDGISDTFSVSIIGDTEGSNFAWVITNESLDILDIVAPENETFDLEGAGNGVCLIWRIAYEDDLDGAEIGKNAADLSGCYNLSNPITVKRNGVNAGNIEIEGGATEIEICAGDGNSDAFNVNVTGETEGANFAWVITDDSDDLNILALPEGPAFDLEGAGDGTCLIWRIAFEDGLVGAEVGASATNLTGCFDLSNAITVIRNGVSGGTISGGDENSFEFTVGDDSEDKISENAITLTDNIGENSKWLITDEDGKLILGVYDNYTDPDFNGAGEGTCLLWYLSFNGDLQGLQAVEGEDHLVANLAGCFSLSNAIKIIRTTTSSSKISIFPNPSKEEVFLDLVNFSGSNFSISIHDVNNSRLDSKELLFQGLSKKVYLDVSGYNSGIYFIQVKNLKTGLNAIKRLVIE